MTCLMIKLLCGLPLFQLDSYAHRGDFRNGNVSLFVPVPGIYQFQITAKANEVWSEFIHEGGGGFFGGELYVSDGGHLG